MTLVLWFLLVNIQNLNGVQYEKRAKWVNNFHGMFKYVGRIFLFVLSVINQINFITFINNANQFSNAHTSSSSSSIQELAAKLKSLIHGFLLFSIQLEYVLVGLVQLTLDGIYLYFYVKSYIATQKQLMVLYIKKINDRR